MQILGTLKTESSELLSILAYDSKGNKRDFKKTFNFIDGLFKELNIKYTIVGAMALGLYAKPRNTLDIDILIYKSTKNTFIKYLKDNKIKYKVEDTYQLRIPPQGEFTDMDILLGFGGPELYAIETSKEQTILGVKVKVATPEALLWMYLGSDLDKHKLDAINLIKSGKVNTLKLRKELEDEDPYLLDILAEWTEEAGKKVTKSYTNSILKREKRNKTQK